MDLLWSQQKRPRNYVYGHLLYLHLWIYFISKDKKSATIIFVSLPKKELNTHTLPVFFLLFYIMAETRRRRRRRRNHRRSKRRQPKRRRRRSATRKYRRRRPKKKKNSKRCRGGWSLFKKSCGLGYGPCPKGYVCRYGGHRGGLGIRGLHLGGLTGSCVKKSAGWF